MLFLLENPTPSRYRSLFSPLEEGAGRRPEDQGGLRRTFPSAEMQSWLGLENVYACCVCTEFLVVHSVAHVQSLLNTGAEICQRRPICEEGRVSTHQEGFDGQCLRVQLLG